MNHGRPPFEIRNYSLIPDWDRFVVSHRNGSIHHSTQMIRCEESTKLHQPYAYGALDCDGALAAILVAVRVSALASLPGQVSSRSILYAEPICVEGENGRDAMAVLLEAHDRYMSSRTLFAEVRPIFDMAESESSLSESGYDRLGYLNYELSLDGSEAEHFDRVGQKVRNNVRSAVRQHVTVEEIELKNCIETVYQLITHSYARSKIPIVDVSHFVAASQTFAPDQLKVLIAEQGGVPISVGCFLSFKDRVTCWYAGTRRIPGVPAMSLVFWEAIRLYASKGYKIFDFAGAGWQGENYGPGKFKRKFGGMQTNHGRYRKVYAPWMMLAAQSVFKNFRGYVSPKVPGAK